MSYWPQADATGNITEEIYLRIKIPRLNMSIRNTEPYKVQVLRPTIKNFGINCIRNSQNHLLWTCSPKKIIKILFHQQVVKLNMNGSLMDKHILVQIRNF